MRHYGLIGAGGFAREVMPLAQIQLAEELSLRTASLQFVVEGDIPNSRVNSLPVIKLDEFLNLPGERFFNIAIADSRARERIAIRCIQSGASAFAISANNVLNLSDNQVAEGAIFCPFSMVTANAQIGKFFHANLYSYVAHDCKIGNFVTFAPNVHCNGNIVIEDHAYIGTGAMLRPGQPSKPLVIGEGAVIGMGAVVTKDVPPGSTVVGNPAHILDKSR